MAGVRECDRSKREYIEQFYQIYLTEVQETIHISFQFTSKSINKVNVTELSTVIRNCCITTMMITKMVVLKTRSNLNHYSECLSNVSEHNP